MILSLEALILYFSTFCGKICDHLFITKDQMATKPAAAVASYIDFWGKKYGCALSSLQLSRFFQLDKKPMRHHLCCSNFILESIWKRVGRIVQCSSRVKRSRILKITDSSNKLYEYLPNCYEYCKLICSILHYTVRLHLFFCKVNHLLLVSAATPLDTQKQMSVYPFIHSQFFFA